MKPKGRENPPISAIICIKHTHDEDFKLYVKLNTFF